MRKLLFVLVAATLLAACAPTDAQLQATSVADLMQLATDQAGEPKVQPTAMPTQASTVEATEAPAAETVAFADNGNPVVNYDWGSANVPAEVTTEKGVGSPCYMPAPTCYFFNAAGVLGADDYDEAMANASAVWTGSAVYHNKPQGPVVGDTVPEAGYWSAFAQSFDVEVGGYHLILNRTENVCGWGLVIRGLFSEDGVDRHTPITFSNYGAVGAASYTRYAVPVEAGQYFSQDYWSDQFKSGLDFDNCGIGSEDAFAFYSGVLDLNDGSLTVLYYDENGWASDAVDTNVVGHGNK